MEVNAPVDLGHGFGEAFENGGLIVFVQGGIKMR